MSEEIIVPILGQGFNFGESSNYQKLSNKWFEQTEFDEMNFMYKAIIMDITYLPDEIYSKTDGYWGTCWIAEVLDGGDENAYKKYRFRNFIDLVEFYKNKGYRFVE